MTGTPKPPEEILDKGQNNNTIADWESLANYDNGDIGREPNCTNHDQPEGTPVFDINDPLYKRSILYGDHTGALIDMTQRGTLGNPKISLRKKRSFKIVRSSNRDPEE